MIRLAKTKDIDLIFIRVKRRRDLVPESQSEELRVYMKKLEEYFQQNDIEYIDFTDESRIKEEHYAGGDHMKAPEGSRLFTGLLVEALGKHFDSEGLPAPIH